MKRFILNREPDKNGIVRLEGDDYHYLVRVRRLAPGEFFPALLPNGDEVLIQVRSVEGGTLVGAISEEYLTRGHGGTEDTASQTDTAFHTVAALPPIILLQALPKGEKMDLIVRQAAEGGVSEIIPFVSEFSIPKIKGDADSGGKKQARWERIIKEARQQSGSAVATAIRPPLGIDGLFAAWEEIKQKRPGALGLLLHHLPLAQASLHGYLNTDPETVALAIGPEGGFSPAEVSCFLETGFKALTIGDTILRTETAALYGAAAIRIILLERKSWAMK
ncbi:ribosomal RNA small subunit methyltransferase E [Spirochaetia bacterium]|nr:ribosomal RNA small subunit methyltransferase E [Spirochaetia bacterium]